MAEFWHDNIFLVTGGRGFLGSYVVEGLQARGAKVYAPTHKEYDLRDATTIHRLLRYITPTVVIHLAAHVGGIGANRERPAEFFYDNLIMGTQLLHWSCMSKTVTKFVTAGTVCAYPKHTPVPFSEADLWNGYPEETNAPYGIAKKALLVQGQAYRDQYGFNSIYLLPTNLYGPRDNFDPASSHVIPALIRKAVQAKEQNEPQMVVWGTGAASREFLYVEDAAEAIVQAAECYNDPEPVNLGAGGEIRIGDLAAMIVEMVGYKGVLVWDTDKPDGQPRRSLDATRARESFGWTARTAFRDGLRRTIDWYIEQRKLEKAA